MIRIPFYSPGHQHAQIKNQLIETFDRVVNGNWFVMGKELESFEQEFASYQGNRFCAGVGNGFDALFISLKVLDIGRGDEVIVPANTYIATWLAISNAGAVPVPVDANPMTWLMDEEKIVQAITPKTKAILPVHLYGLPSDMNLVMAIAKEHKLKVIEDTAQAAGAMFKNKKMGGFGDCGAFSFYPTKNLGAFGDGGAIVTNDEAIYQKILSYRNYGQSKKNHSILKGVNSRLDEIQAAFLRIKLARLDLWNGERKSLARRYKEQLRVISDVKIPEVVASGDPVYHLFPICVQRRDELKSFLFSRGIETMVHYPLPPFKQDAYSEFQQRGEAFPIAEEIAVRELSLPIWPGMREEDISYVCDHVKKFFEPHRNIEHIV
jgi:dTDP-4-amino-4,6-dideoxygalactose transaminase